MNRTRRTKAILLSLTLTFVLAIGAGVVVGMAAGRHTPVSPAIHPTSGPSSLVDELKLTPEQHEKMKAIWSETMHGPPQKANDSRRSQLFKERDDALYNLLTDEQKTQYQKLMADYSAKLTDLNKEREKAIQEAVERTKQILTEPQRLRYDQMLKEHGPPGGPGSHGDRPDHGDRGQHPPHGPHGTWPNHGPGRFNESKGDPRTQPVKPGAGPNDLKDNEVHDLPPASRPV